MLKSDDGNALMLDCGIKYEEIVKNLGFLNINAILVTHFHSDHCLSLDKLKKFRFKIYSPENIDSGQKTIINDWIIMPMKLVHNVECFGFLIYNKKENKKVAYITDTTYIPKMEPVDCLIIDCNYDKNLVEEKISKGGFVNWGHKNHLSIQQVEEYVKNLNYKLPNLVAYHLSSSGLNTPEKTYSLLKDKAQNVFIGKKDLSFNF